MLPNDKSKKKSVYDSRSHDQRIADLRSACIELFAKARLTGKKTDASQAKILKKARVHKDYFYKEKIKDEAVQQRYYDVRDEIADFNRNFNKLPHEDTLQGKYESLYEQEKERAINLEQHLVSSREQVAGLYEKIANLQSQNKNRDNDVIRLSHQALQAGRQKNSNTVNFTNVRYISPDQYLRRNGVYCFDDEALKASAWSKSEKELHTSLSRNIPMRVYMLIGPMCAGKTFWSNNTKSYWHDRHPVVIDATNLSVYHRLKWFNIINQYIRTNDISVCGVIFDTPLDVLLSRSKNNEPGKKVPENIITEKFYSMEWPDLKEEKFNEIVVIRHG
ncbi:hypothetical protein [Pseudoalteromonas sp. DL-6]|uniref:hypothetical protein n=1 Tax=Pseudoalteromonas sp. DL-6 TaxID=1390185 RepID=UPI00103CFCE6|nr:hypothetical protein [Pseudoalteromonas sp. DL-6]QBJ61641.1 hypothetical protein B1F84_00640 [Pseudoalteromonas sp. DL-6]